MQEDKKQIVTVGSPTAAFDSQPGDIVPDPAEIRTQKFASWQQLASLSFMIILQLVCLMAWVVLRYSTGTHSSIPVFGITVTLTFHIPCVCLFALTFPHGKKIPDWWDNCLAKATSTTFILDATCLALSRADVQHWLHYEVENLPDFFQGAALACEAAGDIEATVLACEAAGDSAEELCLVGQSQMTHGLALFWCIYFVLFIVSSKHLFSSVIGGSLLYVMISGLGASSLHLAQVGDAHSLFLYSGLSWWVLSLGAMVIARVTLDRAKCQLLMDVESQQDMIQELSAVAKGLDRVARHLCEVVIRLDGDLRAFELGPGHFEFFKCDMKNRSFTELIGLHDQARFLTVFEQVQQTPLIPGCINVTLQLDSGPCEASLLIAATGTTVPSYLIGMRVEGFRIPPAADADGSHSLPLMLGAVNEHEIQHYSVSEYSAPSLQAPQDWRTLHTASLELNFEAQSLKLIDCSDAFAKLIGPCPPGSDTSCIFRKSTKNMEFYKGLQDHANQLYWADDSSSKMTSTTGSSASQMTTKIYEVSVVLHSSRGVEYKAQCRTTLRKALAKRGGDGVHDSGVGIVAHSVLTNVLACLSVDL